jgi:hypothetical protein
LFVCGHPCPFYNKPTLVGLLPLQITVPAVQEFISAFDDLPLINPFPVLWAPPGVQGNVVVIFCFLKHRSGHCLVVLLLSKYIIGPYPKNFIVF